MQHHCKGHSMPIITLPDGSQRQFDNPVSTMEVAQSIGPVLQKQRLLVVLTVTALMRVI